MYLNVSMYFMMKTLLSQAIIFYAIRSTKLVEWLTSEDIRAGLAEYHKKSFIEKEATFNQNIDEDYDVLAKGVSRNSFYNTYSDWIMFCAGRRSDVSSGGWEQWRTGPQGYREISRWPLVNTLFDAPILNKIMKRMIKLLK